MAISAKRRVRACFSDRRLFGLGGRGRLGTACLAVTVALGCSAIARQGAAMFVSTPEKTSPPATEAEAASDTVPREDVQLQRQIQEIAPVAHTKRKTNSNTFLRMSGESEKTKPVAIPASSVKSKPTSAQQMNEPIQPSDKIFRIGSWAFILACLGAAAIGLFKIKKLASSG